VTEYKKKLIEVALPLEAINRESAREKSIRHGHPSTLHLWWARRPLATCRAVLFASLVDDPSAHPEQFPTDETQEAERQRLFRIIEELVKWENSTNETVLGAARAEIVRSTGGDPPPVLDPFCGGGSIPLEAQRLGLQAYASDLNPVAVLITKALIEIPPKFANLPPVNPEAQAKLGNSGWRGAQGLADDVRYYGGWLRDEAERRVGHLYPKVTLPEESGGGEATVVAWLWARTVKCPNPACGVEMPLVRSFELSTRIGRQAWVEPIIDAAAKTVRFEVKLGTGIAPDGTVNRRGARCVACGSSVPFTHIRSEGQRHGLGAQLMAIVAEGNRGRVYLGPDDAHAAVAANADSLWEPDAYSTPSRTPIPRQAEHRFHAKANSDSTPRRTVS
jgi:putative DNA methylase